MDEFFINVPYEELESSKTKDKPVYLSIGEVAKRLNEEPSTIRYWSNKYHDLLEVELCNTHRRYSLLDVDKLKLIQKCKNRNLSHNEIIMALKETDFELEKVDEIIQLNNQPLDVQLFVSAMMVEMDNKMQTFQDAFIESLRNDIKANIETQERLLTHTAEMIQQEVALTVDEVVTEKIEAFKEEYESKRQEEMEIRQRELDMYRDLRNRLDNKKQESDKKQGFFSRIIGRK